MKGFLLAAGEGTRLKPLTDKAPKCLVPIGGIPLLAYWLRLCEKHGVEEVLVNLHHLADQVVDYVQTQSFRVRVQFFYEDKLLGTAGTVAANRDFVEREESFFVFYGDNLTNVNLERMLEYHRAHGGLLTMGLFRTDRPREAGIARLDEQNLIVDFAEKPRDPMGNLANAGIYIARPGVFEYFPEKPVLDFGYDVLPKLVGEMFGYVIEEYLIDIGCPEDYARAQREWDPDWLAI